MAEVLISGYVEEDKVLYYAMSKEELKIYLLEDIKYRISSCEYEIFDCDITKLKEDVRNKLIAEINNKAENISDYIDFEKYYESGIFCGYDYDVVFDLEFD